MKKQKVIFWIATGLLTLQMGSSGLANLLRAEDAVRTIRLLGYPDYFPVMLGVAKLLGLVGLYQRFSGKLTEWAYAGFAFDIIAAIVSHLAVQNITPELFAGFFGLAVLFVSYFLRGKIYATAPPSVAY